MDQWFDSNPRPPTLPSDFLLFERPLCTGTRHWNTSEEAIANGSLNCSNVGYQLILMARRNNEIHHSLRV